MTPSQRIHHIREIARELRKEEWPFIDLTLKQFQLPWSEQWSGGDKAIYIMDMIGNAADATLLDLAKHLGTASELEPVVSPRFWSQDDARIFISHVSAIKQKTAALKVTLTEYGIHGFVAHDDIEPTSEWQDEIEAALSSMDALVAVLTPGFNESKWCDQEVGVAIGRRVPIVPVRVELDPYGFFGKYQAIPGKGKSPQEVAALVFSALIPKPQVGPKITNRLVRMTVDSKSWDQSRRLMALIEQSVYLTPDHVRTLKKASVDNAEVGHAWNVPEKIAELEAKYGT